MEVVRLRNRVEIDSDIDLVQLYRRQARTCQDIVNSLNKLCDDNVDFFIQTGGFEQIRMNEDEVKRRLEMADELESVR